MPPLPKSGATVELDRSQWDRDYSSIMADASKLDAALDDLGGTVDVKVSIDDGELKTAAGLRDDLNANTSMKVQVDDSEIDTVIGLLNDILSLEVIDIALSVSGTAVGFVQSLGRFSGIGGLIEMDDALASIEGRTGRMIPQAEELINDLYTNGWGESREQIAGVITAAAQLGIANDDLAEATFAAFNVAAITGDDATEVLRAMDTMVKNNLVPDFNTAADVIAVGLQTGANRGQDLLDTFNEYGSTFSQLRISGEGALSLINSGLDAGVDNSDRIADAIRETGIRLREIGTDENIANAFSQLDSMSDIDLATSLDAFNAGEITGDQFFEGFFQAFEDANTADPQQAASLFTTLIGTISEDFGPDKIAQLTTVWDTEVMGVMEGRAAEAGTTISDTLGTTLESFMRAIEVSATDFLSSDALNLDEKLDTFKTQLQAGLATLQGGGSLGDALEVSFGITGVDDALSNIQRVFGQMVISLLEIVALLQDPLGVTDSDKGTRGEIARLAEGQLAFDLQIANADEIGALVDQALNRGVSASGVMGAISTALDEAVAGGDFDQVVDLLTGFTEQALATGADATVVSDFVSSYTDQLTTGFDTAIADGDFNLAKKIADAQDDPTAYTDALAGVFGFNTAALDASVAALEEGMSPQIDAVVQEVADAELAINTSNASIGEASLAAALIYAAAQQSIAEESTGAIQYVEDVEESIDSLGVTAGNTSAAIDGMMAKIGEGNTAIAGANLSAGGPEARADGGSIRAGEEYLVGEEGPEIISTRAAGMVYDAGQTAAMLGGGWGGVTNYVYNINMTNIVQSQAQAVAGSYALGKMIRG